MRTIAVLALAVSISFGAPALGRAQDEEEQEEGGEIDDLMTSDPEKAAEEKGDAEEDEEAPKGDSEDGEGEMATDDERPPGDEPSASDEPDEAVAEVDTSSDGHPNPVSIGVLVGLGFSLESGGDPWGLGFGLRGGYNLDNFYVGARFAYHLGETYTQTRSVFGIGQTRMEEVTINLWELGAEAGFDIHAGDLVVIRPGLGIGFVSVSASTTETTVFVAPGLSLLLEPSPTFFLGVDVRYQFVATEQSLGGITALGNIGMRF